MIQKKFEEWLNSPEMSAFFKETSFSFEIHPGDKDNDELRVDFHTGTSIGEIQIIPKVGTLVINSGGYSSRVVFSAGTKEILLPRRTSFLSSAEDFKVFDDFFLKLIGEPLARIAECHYLSYYISPYWSVGSLIYSEVIETELSYRMAGELEEKLNKEKGYEFIKFEALLKSDYKAPFAASCDLSERDFYLEDYKQWVDYKHWKD